LKLAILATLVVIAEPLNSSTYSTTMRRRGKRYSLPWSVLLDVLSVEIRSVVAAVMILRFQYVWTYIKSPMISDPACGLDSPAASLDMFNGDFSVHIDLGKLRANVINVSLL